MGFISDHSERVAAVKQDVFRAITLGEAELGKPLYYVEIVASFTKNIEEAASKVSLIQFSLVELFRDDKVLATKDMHKFSVNPAMQNTESNKTDYMLFSDRVALIYPGYQLDHRLCIRAGPTSATLNFDKLRELFLSKDLSRCAEFDWMKEESNRFLDGTVDMLPHSVAFSSYPRAGNSFLRRYFETITGITTGSNFANQTITEFQLRMQGLKGGDCVCDDNTVWITKIHPLVYPRVNQEFSAAKQIALFRNPIDLLVSYFNMVVLLSHSLEATKPLTEIEEWHTVFVPTMVRRIKEFFVNVQATAEQIPTFYVTYEQLILTPEQTLTEMFQFLLGVDSLEGTVIQQRIRDAVAEGHHSKAVYTLKFKD